VNEPALIRTTLRPFRFIFVVESVADVEKAREICDSALGGRLNLLLPATSIETDDVLRMLSAFDPDAIVADTLTLPTSVRRLRLPTIPSKEPVPLAFPSALSRI
jgi:hypothetical protein